MNFRVFKNKQDTSSLELKCSTRDAIGYIFLGLTIIGINMPKTHQLAYPFYVVLIYGMGNVLLSIILLISCIKAGREVDMKTLFSSFQVALNVWGCALKISILACNKRKLHATKILMEKLDTCCIDEDEKQCIRNIVTFTKRIISTFLFIYFSYSICSFLGSAINRKPRYSVQIPFLNYRRSISQLAIACLTDFTMINILCLQQVVCDSYAVIYIIVLRNHIQVLLLRISKLCYDSNKTKDENTQDLVNCIIDHKNIIRLSELIRPAISKTIFIQFLITALIFGITLINMTLFGNVSTIIASVVYMSAIVLQCFPCCYFANSVIDKSYDLSNAILHSNWVDQNANFRKMLVFFQQRLQKPITFTAGDLFPINISSFMAIAKFSFSLYTLLSGMDYGNHQK